MSKSNDVLKGGRVLMWANVINIISFIFYFLGTIMQRESNQWSREHMKHNVSHVNEEKMNGTEDDKLLILSPSS